MLEPAPLRAESQREDLQLVRVRDADLTWYRDAFRRFGANWLWFARLELSDDELAEMLSDPNVELFVLHEGGREIGIMELDFIGDECELRYFGLDETAIGTGVGRWLMNRAIEGAWRRPIRRFAVRTCTHDHPGAVPFYVRSGFRAYRRQIEITNDPRLSGLLPREVAPGHPIL
jgi:GNAT superfamily N-acetyltransferase